MSRQFADKAAAALLDAITATTIAALRCRLPPGLLEAPLRFALSGVGAWETR
jgi:hypothetical protein